MGRTAATGKSDHQPGCLAGARALSGPAVCRGAGHRAGPLPFVGKGLPGWPRGSPVLRPASAGRGILGPVMRASPAACGACEPFRPAGCGGCLGRLCGEGPSADPGVAARVPRSPRRGPPWSGGQASGRVARSEILPRAPMQKNRHTNRPPGPSPNGCPWLSLLGVVGVNHAQETKESKAPAVPPGAASSASGPSGQRRERAPRGWATKRGHQGFCASDGLIKTH